MLTFCLNLLGFNRRNLVLWTIKIMYTFQDFGEVVYLMTLSFAKIRCIASAVDECWVPVGRYWQGNPKYWEKNLFQCHCVHTLTSIWLGSNLDLHCGGRWPNAWTMAIRTRDLWFSKGCWWFQVLSGMTPYWLVNSDVLDDVAAPKLISLPLQLWLHESAWILCYTYIACLVLLYAPCSTLSSVSRRLSVRQQEYESPKTFKMCVCVYLFIYKRFLLVPFSFWFLKFLCTILRKITLVYFKVW